MRNQLISYVELLFAGNPEAAEMRQEILQNTLDRYDDLVAQGNTPERAYSLAISGIGDVSELLQGSGEQHLPEENPVRPQQKPESGRDKLLRAIAVGLYILCPVPLFVFQNEVGLCLLLTLVAIATVILIFAGKGKKQEQGQLTPEDKLKNSIHSIVSTVGLIVYFLVSFLTGAWHLTWLIFPIIGAVNGLISAIMDLKEAR